MAVTLELGKQGKKNSEHRKSMITQLRVKIIPGIYLSLPLAYKYKFILGLPLYSTQSTVFARGPTNFLTYFVVDSH